LFERGYNLANRPAAQTTGAKGESFEKSIIELAPMSAINQFSNDALTKIAANSLQQGLDIVQG
jgi:hypothetical protein